MLAVCSRNSDKPPIQNNDAETETAIAPAKQHETAGKGGENGNATN